MKHKIWYSVQSGGDGSAYPEFMESEGLCKIDQEYMDENWAEDCSGCLVIESDSPIKVLNLTTIDEVIKEIEEKLNEDYMKKYKAQGKYPEWFERLEGKLAAVKALKNANLG